MTMMEEVQFFGLLLTPTSTGHLGVSKKVSRLDMKDPRRSQEDRRLHYVRIQLKTRYVYQNPDQIAQSTASSKIQMMNTQSEASSS